MSYCTVDQLAEYLGLSEGGDHALLDDLVDRAQAAINTYTGRTFEAAANNTRYLDARDVDGRMLYLGADLCSITSITNGDGATVASTKYTTEPRNEAPWYALRMKQDAGVLWDGTSGEIAIVGRWAWSVTAPLDITHACVRLAGWMYRQRDNANTDGDRTVVVGNATVLPMRFPNDVASLLAPYRRYR